jgi:hypothetical protein
VAPGALKGKRGNLKPPISCLFQNFCSGLSAKPRFAPQRGVAEDTGPGPGAGEEAGAGGEASPL